MGDAHCPLGLALALRGGPLPAVELDPRAVSFHAGHTLSARRPFVAGRTYGVRARIAEVFEKSGRSGPLTVVVRTAELYDAERRRGGHSRAADRALARSRTPPSPRPASRFPTTTGCRRRPTGIWTSGRRSLSCAAGRRTRRRCTATPARSAVGSRSSRIRTSRADWASPTSSFPGRCSRPSSKTCWRTTCRPGISTELSLSFRVSVVVDEPIASDAPWSPRCRPRADRLVADLTLENSSGERAAVGHRRPCAAVPSCTNATRARCRARSRPRRRSQPTEQSQMARLPRRRVHLRVRRRPDQKEGAPLREPFGDAGG